MFTITNLANISNFLGCAKVITCYRYACEREVNQNSKLSSFDKDIKETYLPLMELIPVIKFYLQSFYFVKVAS